MSISKKKYFAIKLHCGFVANTKWQEEPGFGMLHHKCLMLIWCCHCAHPVLATLYIYKHCIVGSLLKVDSTSIGSSSQVSPDSHRSSQPGSGRATPNINPLTKDQLQQALLYMLKVPINTLEIFFHHRMFHTAQIYLMPRSNPPKCNAFQAGGGLNCMFLEPRLVNFCLPTSENVVKLIKILHKIFYKSIFVSLLLKMLWN